jgi:hypothetical protein
MKQTHLHPRGAVALAVIGLLSACTDPTGAAGGLIVVRATAVERPLPGAAPVISYRVENMSSLPVFILACGERLVAELEQRRAGGSAWAPADAAVRCPAHLLYLPVAVGAHDSGEGNITAPGEGTYRLRMSYRVGHAAGPSEAAASAPVEVSAP